MCAVIRSLVGATPGHQIRQFGIVCFRLMKSFANDFELALHCRA